MNILESETSRGLKEFKDIHDKFVWKRISDASSTFCFTGQKKPGDFDCIYNGKYYLIECKSTKSNRFYLGNIREHQYKDMLEYLDAGANSYFLISFRGKKDINYFAINPIDLYAAILDKLLSGGKTPASFSVDDMLNSSYFIRLGIKHDLNKKRFIDFKSLFE